MNAIPSQLQAVPFDYILKWGSKHFDSVPELKYLRTLNNSGKIKNLNDIYIQGVLKDCKKLSELRDALIRLENEIVSDYAESKKVEYLPADPTLEGVNAFEAFVKEYFAMVESTVYNEKQRKSLKIYLFPQHIVATNNIDIKSIAKMVSFSRQRVDQVVENFTERCRRILDGETVDGVCAVGHLVDWFQGRKNCDKDMTLSSFRKLVGLDSTQVHLERFLCNVFGVSVPRDLNNGNAVMSSMKTKVDRNSGDVKKQFKRWVAPVSELMFEGFLVENFEDEELRNALRTYVMTSDEYEHSVVDGENYIALKWECLGNHGAEVARILLDNEVYTIKDAMHREEILQKHRSLSILHNKKLLDELNKFSSDLVIPLGKTGYYKLKQPNEQFVEAIDFAREYVLEKMESATKEDFISRCDEEGYTHIYPQNTLLEYYKKFVKNVKGARDIHRSECVIKLLAEILKKSGGHMRAADLKVCAERKLKISNLRSFYVCLRKAENIIWHLQKEKKEIQVVLMNVSVADFDFNVFKGQVKSADYKETLRDAVINILQNVPDNKMPMVEIIREIESLLPSDIAFTNIYKIFNDSGCFIKTNGAGREKYLELTPSYRTVVPTTVKMVVPEETLWERVKKILCREFAKFMQFEGVSIYDAVEEMYEIMMLTDDESDGSTIYDILDRLERYYLGDLDRERLELLFGNIIGELEPFMKSLYKRNTGEKISDIGLQPVFAAIQSKGVFPDRYDTTTNLAREFNRLIKNSIFKRNQFHENFRIYKTVFDFHDTIHSFLKLLIFASAYSVLNN